jgi:hypothetical protein
MSLSGHIQDGGVVLDEPAALPNGTPVTVEPVRPEPAFRAEGPNGKAEPPLGPSLYDCLKEVIGKAAGLPEDAALNVEHYLYGHPKR